MAEFWHSVDLTGNQTSGGAVQAQGGFWHSVDLTGNQTVIWFSAVAYCFGTVSI